MAKERKYKYLSCDFETTVYEGQVSTEVWASACVELYTEDVKIFGSIDETFSYFKSLKSNLICYYHNLKFDGSFWLSYLLVDLGMEQAVKPHKEETDIVWVNPKKMRNNTFQYSISDKSILNVLLPVKTIFSNSFTEKSILEQFIFFRIFLV